MRRLLCFLVLMFSVFVVSSCKGQEKYQVETYERLIGDSAVKISIVNYRDMDEEYGTDSAPLLHRITIRPQELAVAVVYVRQCTKLPLSWERAKKIDWFVVEADGFRFFGFPPGERYFAGYSFLKTNRIWLAAPEENSFYTIAHELVHFAMNEKGLPAGHDPKYFGPCGLMPIG